MLKKRGMAGFGRTAGFGSPVVTVGKLLALGLLLAAAPPGQQWSNVLYDRADQFMFGNHPLYAAAYVAVFAFALLGMVIVPFLRSAYVRVALVALIVVTIAADQLFLDIAGHHLNIARLHIVWEVRGTAPDMIPAYAPYFVRSCLWVIALGAILAIPPARTWSLGLRYGLVPLSAFVFIAAITVRTKGDVQEFLPPFSLPVALAIVSTVEDTESPVLPVEYSGPITPRIKHVVFIVDESVRGDSMEVNEPKHQNTPFLSQHKDHIINFGVAVAGANCSMPSRLMLRYGSRREDFEGSGKRPSMWRPVIWRYAQRAGYRTVLIDPFKGDRYAYMYANEWRSIDQYVKEGELPTYLRDNAIAQRLVELLKEDVPSFIYVNKFGTHFPYELAFPPRFNNFTATPQSRDLAAYWSDALHNFYHDSDLENHEALNRSYSNAILWSVDGFFKNLLGRFDEDRVLLIYTSDHGQSLSEGGQRVSHCSTQNAQVGEGLVPLFAVTGNPEIGSRLRTSAARAFGQATHFEIVPTLLLAMGYQERWVKEHYGPSLFDVPLDRPRQFLIGGDAAPGKWFEGSRWMSVD